MGEDAVTAQERIRTAFERNSKALELRPSVGRGTAVTKVRLREGLTCEVEDGAWKLTVDMGEKQGGNGAGPDPGVFGRTALGSCLTIGYAMWASKLGVSMKSIEVEVQADYDSSGSYGVGENPAGYREVRYIVRVESDASEAEVLRVLDQADAHSPYHDVFSRAQKLVRQTQIHRSGS